MSGEAPYREHWRQVEALFRTLVETPPELRAGVLDEACGDAPALRAEVESLLEAHDGGDDSFLRELDAGGAGEVLESLAGIEGAPDVPEQIGPYRLERELGRGGMGVVYLAERVDGQFEQRVALKVIKRGMDSDAVLARFLHERQILARLEHPNIARLLDGGVTDGGQPWFAMELVDGVPLTRWCDEQRLDLGRRIELFLDVCAAVGYAHRNLVVHRDLKPSNVLIAADETTGGEDQVRNAADAEAKSTIKGTVKLLDFGIAKLLGDDGGHTLLETEIGLRLVTPEYGAPEQLRGEPVSTATDVYSLGVILYELLCGSRPYTLEERSLEETLALVESTEPARPSARASADAAAARSSTTRRLERALSGDLDTIVLKSLRKEPERRYAGSDELAEDLRRHRSGLPILARPARWSYRARRFVGRHWLGVGMATLLVLALALGLIGTTWQGRVAADERDRARAEAARTEQVKMFLVELFRDSEPSRARGEQLTALALLERGIERIDDEFSDEPDLRAELLATVAYASVTLGELERGRELYERALGLEFDASPAGELRRAVVLDGLGEAYVDLLRPDDAEEALKQALAIRQRLAGADSLEVAETSNKLGVALLVRRQWSDAEVHLRRALEIQRRILGEDDVVTLATQYNLAGNLLELGEYAAADRALRTTAERQRAVLGDDHPDLATTLDTLASLRATLGAYVEAVRLTDEVLGIRKKILGEEHPHTMITTNNLAMRLLAAGDSRRAGVLMRSVLEQNLRQFGPGHPYVALAKGNLGRSLAEQGRFDEAMGLFDEALAIYTGASDPNRGRVASTLRSQAEVTRRASGSLSEAVIKIDRALELLRAEPDPAVDQLARATAAAAAIHAELGRTQEAEDLYRSALALQVEHQGENHPKSAVTRRGLGDLLVATGRASEAEIELRRAQEIWQATFPEDHWRQGEALVSLGICRRAQGEAEEGERLIRQGLERLESTRGKDDWRARAARAAARAPVE